jgi:hypothetical protein
MRGVRPAAAGHPYVILLPARLQHRGGRRRSRPWRRGGAIIPSQQSVKALQGVSEDWARDDNAGVVWIRVPDRGTAVKVKVAQ